MRVIAGSSKGRRLATIKGAKVRPTSDKVRGAVFNVLEHSPLGFTFKKVLDLFAGTGAMGLEALSRGADEALFVESSAAAVSVIRENIELCGFSACTRVIDMDVRESIERLARGPQRFDLVFMDAPYAEGVLADASLTALVELGLLNPGAYVVCEGPVKTPGRETLPRAPKGLELFRRKSYGDTEVSIFRKSQEKVRR